MKINESNQSLNVYFFQDFVGKLNYFSHGKISFQYDTNWLSNKNAMSISVSLPLQEQPFPDEKTRPFFSNLLPDANIRDSIAIALRISNKNDFAFLEALGGECAGAITLLVDHKNFSKEQNSYRLLTNEELDHLAEQLAIKPFFINKKNVRLSLAGSQLKLPVKIENNNIFLPLDNSPSTHIIKPENKNYKNSVINEYFCMQLAYQVGLPVPKTQLMTRKNERWYVIERYDRKISDKKIYRLHQEDFCQVLGIMPDQKYENEGGPSLLQCFHLIKDFSSQPAKDIEYLLKCIIFNLFIGNADAHGKNFSFLYQDNQRILAPFYDLFSTAVYDDLTKNMAMKLANEKRINFVFTRHWQQFAEIIDVKSNFIFDLLEEIKNKIDSESKKLIKTIELNQQEKLMINSIINFIQKQMKRI